MHDLYKCAFVYMYVMYCTILNFLLDFFAVLVVCVAELRVVLYQEGSRSQYIQDNVTDITLLVGLSGSVGVQGLVTGKLCVASCT